jgi:hypothetical protein
MGFGKRVRDAGDCFVVIVGPIGIIQITAVTVIELDESTRDKSMQLLDGGRCPMSDKTIDRLTERAGPTPGPWFHARDTFGVMRIWDVKNQDDVATTLGDGSISADQREANAHLIAAAPELLEACKNALSTLRAYQMVLHAAGNKPFSIPDFVLSNLKDAISKAEGQP